MSDSGPGQPEYLGTGAPDATASQASQANGTRPGRRRAVVAGAGVAALLAVGAGAYGVVQFLGGGGDSPATAVPGSAIGYISVDLDPSASQKIEAIKILRKFPSLRKQLKVGSRDDVRRRLFEEISKDGDCSKLDYDRDVKPWIGDRVAVAAVPAAGDKVVPLVALQVSDQDKARTGLRKLATCDSQDGPMATAFVGDYALVGEKQSVVDRLAKDAETSPLADDADYKTWMGRTGDPGIVTMYAAKDAVDVATRAAHASVGANGFDMGTAYEKQLRKAFKDFGGAAGVVRFKDGAVEAELQAKGLGRIAGTGSTGGPDVRTLPATIAAVLSLSLPHGWLDTYVSQLKSQAGPGEFDRIMAEGERRTGLKLPEDVGTLLGNGLSVSADSSADLDALRRDGDPTKLPVGVRLQGDPDKITAIVTKLQKLAGPEGGLVKTDSSGDLVAVGTDPSYLSTLVGKGSLGSQRSFEQVVPHADRAGAVLFVDFDAGDGWADKLADLLSDGDPTVKADVAPLDAFGASGWVDGAKIQHSLLRLTTD
jgi:Protein of unknown function (DUF3352)